VDDGKMSKELKRTVAINDHRNNNDELIAKFWLQAGNASKRNGAPGAQRLN
jgi:hypothetical protein